MKFVFFKDGDTTIIARAAATAPTVPQPQPQNVNVNVGNVYVAKEKHMNKHVFDMGRAFSLARLVSIAL